MDKELLEKLINENLSTRQIGTKIGKSQSSIKHWLKKYGLKTNFNLYHKTEYGSHKWCTKCQKDCPIDHFYNSKSKPNGYAYCKSCLNNLTVEKQRKLKRRCIEYKGGECVVCGYNKYEGAMDFHHVNPEEKDFTISRHKNKSFEKIKKELDKCILLCNRCHQEVEGGFTFLK